LGEDKWRERLPELIKFGEDGASYAVIGDHYGVTRERIRQVLLKHIPKWDELYGLSARRWRREDAHDKQRFQKWGKKTDSPLYASQRKKFYAKKHNAERVGHTLGIEFGDIEWPTHCPLLGIAIDYFAPTRQENSPSFDQIVPGAGYIKGNVLVTSWRGNRIKNDGTAEEHRRIAEWLEQQ
jgi:hypothetical protein